MISLIAEFRVPAVNAEAFEQAAVALVDATNAHEPGVIFYRLFRSTEDADLFRFVEVYADQAAVDLHMRSDWLRSASQAFRRPRLEWSASIAH